MVVYCCAFGCSEKFVKGGRITFHAFPKNPQRRRLWELQLRRKNFKATDHTRICSKHFTPESFDTTKFGGTHLKNDAIPTIFEFPKHLQKQNTGIRKPPQKRFKASETEDTPVDCQNEGCDARLEKHVASLQEVISELQKKRFISDEATTVLKNAQQLENWQKVIPRVDKLITSKDRICELHFTEDDISRYFERTLYDGSDFKLERERPLLKENAIPTIFPNLPEYSKRISKVVKKMKSERFYSPPKPVIISVLTETDPTEFEVNLNNKDDQSSNSNMESEQSCTPDNEVEENLTFDELVQNLKLISTPNVFWGVTAHDAYIMCARWDENYSLKKRVIIDLNLKIKVFLGDTDFSSENADVRNFEEISSLLDDVENFQLNS